MTTTEKLAESEREAFEAHASENGKFPGCIHTDERGEYTNPFTHPARRAWLAALEWQARAALAATPAASLTPEWLWSKLMDWCRQRGMNPAEHNALFRIVSESRKLAATPAAPAYYIDPLDVQERKDSPIVKLASEWHEGLRFKTPLYTAPVAATPAAPPLPDGWKFNHARQQTDDDGPVSGVWEIGWLEDEDGSFSPIITVDTGLYYQDRDAEPLAKAILVRLAGKGKESSKP